MKRVAFIILVLGLLASCGTGMTINGGYRNSIYYASADDIQLAPVEHKVSTEISYEEETYEEKLRKFDSPTYTINLSIDPWYPYYSYSYWRWNRPYYYSWDWYWRPYDSWYFTWSWRYNWHSRFYTFYPRPHYKPFRPTHKPNHKPDVRYTRRGGVTPSYGRPSTNPRPNNRPTARPAQITRQSTARTATQSRRPTVNQQQRTGYSRGTTNRSSNTGRTHYNNSYPSQRTQPSVRYNERSTSSQHSGVSRSSSSGSSTRRK